MSLKAAREGVISALRNGMAWEHEIVTEYHSYQGLPVIVVEVGDFISFTNQEHTAAQYELAVEMRLPIDAVEAAERHRDVTQRNSMSGVLARPTANAIDDAALILTSVSVGVEDEILEDGSSRSLYIYVNADCELYTIAGER